MKLLSIFFIILLLAFTACDNENTTEKTEEGNQSAQSGNNKNAGTSDGSSTENSGSNNNNTLNPSGNNPNSGGQPGTEGSTQYFRKAPFIVEGKVLNSNRETIIIDRMLIGTIEPVQSQEINSEGNFDLNGEVPYPEVYQLRVGHGAIHVPVHPNDHMSFTIDLKDLNNFKVKGSMEPIWLRTMYEILERSNERMQKAKDKLEALRTTNVDKYMKMNDTLSNHYRRLRRVRNNELKQFISKIDTSFTAVLACLRLDPEYDIEFMEKMDKKLAKYYALSPYYKALHTKVETYGLIATGRQAPEIMSMSQNGTPLRLSSLKGKYVLVDFWASWCAPCKEEIPKLKEIYKRYKDKNFEILSVSLDNDKTAWLTSIAKENMPWKHVSDLDGFSSNAAQTYLVKAIPATFLIDPEGKIVDRDLRANELSKKLTKLIF